MNRILKILFFGLIVKPVVLVVLGLNVVRRGHLPRRGPAVIAANHNSHLDALVLMSLYPLAQVHRVRPVAAADYFLVGGLRAWFSLNVIGIIPLERGGRKNKQELFADCDAALDRGDILIVFPEGSRGEPEELGQIKHGLHRLVSDRDDTAITPVVMHGLGRALPRGEALLVPFNCDVIVGEAMPRAAGAEAFSTALQAVYEQLFEEGITRRAV